MTSISDAEMEMEVGSPKVSNEELCCRLVPELCLNLCDPIDTLWTAVQQAPLSFTISQSLLKLMSFELVMPSNHLIFCCPLLLPSIFPSIMVSSNESALHIRLPEYWNFSFSISPSNEYSWSASFRIES